MMRRFILTVLVLTLGVSVLTPAYSAVKVGGSCQKAGSTTKVKGAKLTCIKVGKKLIWSDWTIAPAIPSVPKPTSTKPQSGNPKPVYTDSSEFAPTDHCKPIGPNNFNMGETLGFPRPKNAIPTLGNHKTLVFFVDFLDVPFQAKQISEWKINQIPTFRKYISGMSYGKLDYEVVVDERVFHIKKSSLSYNLDKPHDAPMKANADGRGLLRDAIAAADPDIDFSKFEFFNVVMPATPTIGAEGTNSDGVVIDGKEFNFSSMGPIQQYVDNPKQKIWFLHETGHMMGLVHGFSGGVDMPIWGAMSNGSSPEPEFMAWERYLLGWITDEQNICLNLKSPKTYVVSITPLSKSNDFKKMVTVRIDEKKVLIIEYRNANPLSSISAKDEGVLAYTVDVSKPSNQGAMQTVFSPSNQHSKELATMISGEESTFENVTVKVLGNYKDKSDLEILIR